MVAIAFQLAEQAIRQSLFIRFDADNRRNAHGGRFQQCRTAANKGKRLADHFFKVLIRERAMQDNGVLQATCFDELPQFWQLLAIAIDMVLKCRIDFQNFRERFHHFEIIGLEAGNPADRNNFPGLDILRWINRILPEFDADRENIAARIFFAI